MKCYHWLAHSCPIFLVVGRWCWGSKPDRGSSVITQPYPQTLLYRGPDFLQLDSPPLWLHTDSSPFGQQWQFNTKSRNHGDQDMLISSLKLSRLVLPCLLLYILSLTTWLFVLWQVLFFLNLSTHWTYKHHPNLPQDFRLSISPLSLCRLK